MPNWKINYYKLPSGREPIQEFIEKLPEKARSRAYYTLELLAEFGPILKMPHVKKVSGTVLWELRILGESSFRFFYVAIMEKTFLIIHGFTKREQKTPKKEIETALERLREHKNRK